MATPRPSTSVVQSAESSSEPPAKRHKVMNHVVKNRSSLINSLARDFNDPELSDVIVKVGTHTFYLHKLVLRQSDVFSAMLSRNWSESTRREIKLTEDEFCIPHMESFFRYFYTAEVELSNAKIHPLLILANKYQMADLQESCEEYAKKLLSMPCIPPICVIQWLQLANTRNLKILHKACLDCVAYNITRFLKTIPDTVQPLETLKQIILHRDLFVSDKIKFVRDILNWAKPGDKEAVIQTIALMNLSPKELMDLEKSLALSSRTPLEFTHQQCISNAYRYHALTVAQRKSLLLENPNTSQQWIIPNVNNDGKPLNATSANKVYTQGFSHVIKHAERNNYASKLCSVRCGISAMEAEKEQRIEVDVRQNDVEGVLVKAWLPFGSNFKNCQIKLSVSLLSPRRCATENCVYFWVNKVFHTQGKVTSMGKFEGNRNDISMALPNEYFKEDSPYNITDKSNPKGVFVIGVHLRCFPSA